MNTKSVKKLNLCNFKEEKVFLKSATSSRFVIMKQKVKILRYP